MAAVGSICFAACGNQQQREQSVREEVPLMPDSLLPDPAAFADTIDGKPVALYLLKNGSGIAAAITNFGARIVGVLVPDVQGKPTDVVMGFGSIKEYMSPSERFFWSGCRPCWKPHCKGPVQCGWQIIYCACK